MAERCAGCHGTFAALHRYPSGELRRVVDGTLFAVFLLLAHTTRLIIKQKAGRAMKPPTATIVTHS
jgi:hypothetical protein